MSDNFQVARNDLMQWIRTGFYIACTDCKAVQVLTHSDTADSATFRAMMAGWKPNESGVPICPACLAAMKGDTDA